MYLAPGLRTAGPQDHRLLSRVTVALVGAALLGLTLAPSAPGREADAQLLLQDPYGTTQCVLERVGDQLVRCDNLTGAGVAAPSHVPEAR